MKIGGGYTVSAIAADKETALQPSIATVGSAQKKSQQQQLSKKMKKEITGGGELKGNAGAVERGYKKEQRDTNSEFSNGNMKPKRLKAQANAALTTATGAAAGGTTSILIPTQTGGGEEIENDLFKAQ